MDMTFIRVVAPKRAVWFVWFLKELFLGAKTAAAGIQRMYQTTWFEGSFVI